jgi:exodeoxyribonuclease III
MKIISFNINGVRARIHQLAALIEKHNPDIIGLQETKAHDEVFPFDDITALGYHSVVHGQKAHYGVAMLVREDLVEKIDSEEKGFPTDTDDHQKRMVAVTLTTPRGNKLKVMNGYFPQGDNLSHETKFPYKAQFYQDLMTQLNTNESPEQHLIVMGDINISPIDLDIGIGEANKKRWLKTGKCSFQPIERQWLADLMDWGLVDTFRQLHPTATDKYSWFDYRSKGYDDNRGLRIDVILATVPLTDNLQEADIDFELRGIDKPSDHAPIWSTFDI